MGTSGEPGEWVRDRRGGGRWPAAARERARRAFPALAFLLALCVAAALEGCASHDSGLRPGDRASVAFPGAAAPAAPYSRLPPAPWKTAGARFLEPGPEWRPARLDRTWRSTVERHVVPLARRVSLVPIALTGDGGFIATVFSPAFSGVALVDRSGRRYTPIHAFADPASDQAAGSFDGRWLVWYEYHSHSDLSDFAVFAWDSRDGAVRQIGAAVPAPDGGYWPTSWRRPDVRGGTATWIQGTGPGSRGEVHVVDLETGRDRVVRRRRAGESFLLDGGTVVWSEAATDGVPPRFRAADAATLDGLPLPRALRGLQVAPGLATDGRATAFSDGRWRSVSWTPSPSGVPSRVITARGGHHVGNSIQVAGRYIGFRVAPFTFLADTRTRRYFQVGPGGWMLLDDESLLMVMPSDAKADRGITDVVLVPLREVPPLR